MSQRLRVNIGVFCLLVAVGAGSRLLKEFLDLSLPNFHAVTATALFAGFFFTRRVVAIAVPMVAMVISDMVIGNYAPSVMAAVYVALALPVLCRWLLRSNLTAARVIGTAIGSSVTFFAVTNFAAWYAYYPHTWAGIGRCYWVAVPFFGYSLAGDLAFATALFGTYALAFRREPLYGALANST